MISMIILAIMGVLVLVGIGSIALKDFKLNSIAAVILLALVIGLNFIPEIVTPGFTFSVGTILLYALCALMFVAKGKWSNKLVTLLITAALGGLLYGSTRLSLLFGNTYWGSVNVFYGLIIGTLAIVLTRNAKYAFVASTLSVMMAALLSQIGSPVVSLNLGFDWAVVAGATALVMYTLAIKLMPRRPSKMSYYFEAGRMSDE